MGTEWSFSGMLGATEVTPREASAIMLAVARIKARSNPSVKARPNGGLAPLVATPHVER
jgi:hypothetical protein